MNKLVSSFSIAWLYKPGLLSKKTCWTNSLLLKSLLWAWVNAQLGLGCRSSNLISRFASLDSWAVVQTQRRVFLRRTGLVVQVFFCLKTGLFYGLRAEVWSLQNKAAGKTSCSSADDNWFFFNYHIVCWLLIIQLDDLLAHKFQIFVCHTFS